jgi:hypothetical protein
VDAQPSHHTRDVETGPPAPSPLISAVVVAGRPVCSRYGQRTDRSPQPSRRGSTILAKVASVSHVISSINFFEIKFVVLMTFAPNDDADRCVNRPLSLCLSEPIGTLRTYDLQAPCIHHFKCVVAVYVPASRADLTYVPVLCLYTTTAVRTKYYHWCAGLHWADRDVPCGAKFLYLCIGTSKVCG